MTGRPMKHPPEGLDLTRSLSDIANDCGVSTGTVSRWRREAGVRLQPGAPKLTDEAWRAKVAAKYPGLFAKLGVITDVEIAPAYGITRQAVGLIRARAKIARVPR